MLGLLAIAACAPAPAASPRSPVASPAIAENVHAAPVSQPSVTQALPAAVVPATAALATSAERERAALEAWILAYNAHDAAAFAGLYAEAGQCRSSSETALGRAAIEARTRDFWVSFPDAKMALLQVLSAPNTTIVQYALTATLRGPLAGRAATGQPLALEAASVLTWDPASHILEEHVYLDKLTLLAQVGLSSISAGRRWTQGLPPAQSLEISADEQTANLNALRAMYAAFEERNPVAYAAPLLDSTEWQDNTQPAPYRGSASAQRAFGELLKAMPDAKMQVVHAWSIGDYAVAETVLTGTNTGSLFGRKATRKPINFRSLDIVQMRAAKIVRGTSFADGLELARQLGWEARVAAP